MPEAPEAIALRAWLAEAARSNDPVEAARAAAESLARQPWEVVRVGGALARARMREAPHDLGVDHKLQWISPDAPGALARVPRGAPAPALDEDGRRQRGAFDTPPALVREACARAVAACARAPRRGWDPSCGAGAFLVALAERGIEAEGVEIEPATAAVAQVAAPRARVHQGDGLSLRPQAPVDLVVGNPPYVPPEHQPRELRERLQRELPWLYGRYDLAVPFAARAAEALAPGGGLCLVLPAPLLSQPYARPLRQRWSAEHRLTALGPPVRFPGAVVQVVLVALQAGAGPAPLPDHGLSHASWLRLESAPWDPELRPGDPELLAAVLSRSLSLGELCEIDTGVVSHGSGGGKAALLSDEPAPGLLPYVDARDLSQGRRRWLRYDPPRMHRPKHLSLFQGEKLLVQRLCGSSGNVHVWLDREDLIPGHTLNVVKPRGAAVPLERLAELLRSRAAVGLARLRAGSRLDLYPRELRAWPVPRRWLEAPELPLQAAWELDTDEFARLEALAGPTPSRAGTRAIARDLPGR